MKSPSKRISDRHELWWLGGGIGRVVVDLSEAWRIAGIVVVMILVGNDWIHDR